MHNVVCQLNLDFSLSSSSDLLTTTISSWNSCTTDCTKYFVLRRRSTTGHNVMLRACPYVLAKQARQTLYANRKKNRVSAFQRFPLPFRRHQTQPMTTGSLDSDSTDDTLLAPPPSTHHMHGAPPTRGARASLPARHARVVFPAFSFHVAMVRDASEGECLFSYCNSADIVLLSRA